LLVDVTTFRIFGIPSFSFFNGLGAGAAFLCFISLSRYRKKRDFCENLNLIIISISGLLVGASLFGMISNLLVAWNKNQPITLQTFLSAGIVFYGGLLGFLGMFILISKIRNKAIDFALLDIIAVCIPLFHFFARLACFSAGCCYGQEADCPFSIIYQSARLEPALRIPVQLFEAGANLVIFALTLTFYLKGILKEKLVYFYLLSYATIRFFLEFLRGDEARGFIFTLSFAQVVSLAIICTLLVFFLKKAMENKDL